MNIAIGEKIKDLRRFHGITQNALAAHLGVSNQAVSKWENSVSLPDLSVIPNIASYFGISIDELFGFTPSKSREMQIELYSQALYHFTRITNAAIIGDPEVYTKSHKHELNPLIYEGVATVWAYEVTNTDPESIDAYLKSKAKNEYLIFDENYINCIIAGTVGIQKGLNLRAMYITVAAYVPKDIIKEVTDKFYEACRPIIEENRKISYNQTMFAYPDERFGKPDYLEFLTELPDEKIQKFLHKIDEEGKSETLIQAMRYASGEANKRIMQNIIPENDQEMILRKVVSRDWSLRYEASCLECFMIDYLMCKDFYSVPFSLWWVDSPEKIEEIANNILNVNKQRRQEFLDIYNQSQAD